MKLTIRELKIFIFSMFSALATNVGVAQTAPAGGVAIEDTAEVRHNDEILKTPFGTFNLSQSTGSIFRISGEELRKTPGTKLIEALRGRVPGLLIKRTSNSPGAGGYSYSLNGGTPYILINGQPRGLEVDLREVQEVIVLGDATFNSLLGNLGDNGLIYVVTNGTKLGKPTIEVDYQYGIQTPTYLPELLSASEYAKVINQVANNDGLGDIYSAEAIAAYADGSDPVRYPNIDNQDTYLADFSATNTASLNVYGGEPGFKYSAFAGYNDWQGLEKVGHKTDGRELTFRTKIDTRINDFISANASVFGKFSNNDRNILGPDAIMSSISTTPANAHPLTYGDAYIVSPQYPSNLLSELENGGTHTDYVSNMIFDVGLEFDLNEYVAGLKYSTYAIMHTYNAHSLKTNNAPGLYTLESLQGSDGQDSTGLKLYQKEVIDLTVGRDNGGIQRNFTYGGNVSYLKTFDESILNLNLSHLLYFEPNTTATQADKRNLTFNLNASYALRNKYIAYANLNSSSSAKYIGENKTKFFPTVGLAWVASNESFLADNELIDNLKIRASYGRVGTEYTSTSLLYNDTWGGGLKNGTTYLGTGTTDQYQFGYRQTATGNEEIDWVLYDQFFAGVELNVLKKINLQFNYFNIAISNIISKASEQYASALGGDVYLPSLNFEERRNTGFNANIMFSDRGEDFSYYVSGNVGNNKIVGEKISEVQYPDQYRLQQGQAIDQIMGYESDGLFTAENIADALPQFGEVQVGDVKYVDQNNDGVIDARDQKEIGNSTPRFNYGIAFGFEYKGFNLDVLGNGVAGYDINLKSYDYYTHSGLGNYYASVNKDLPNGNANPRLSVLTSNNNYENSDYWLVNGGYFRISNVELGYTLPKSFISNSLFSNVKLFVRGSNLAVISKVKDLDPEDMNAGVSEYPMMRSFVLGATLKF
ncbi:SusC/RagA family TonB-linked outer membrane protein [Saccharicrinis fermentans]|uniref:TonB-linked outer membrane protein, SusC/RagA family n=1 Tax=Saccharicrinis fermentans DSM 9555 = JCM 21142 TaxID=869213 RepID=W7Y283_9BACT|nr:SusC/RagA family TonB-linked outer membrane protein [Saccharicrinis fermentans]GAF01628.1 TonB-linked outer membrane protein, SusC/RagA family [Saccharicrinis fermentans DSM 9555 = JCM 21142]